MGPMDLCLTGMVVLIHRCHFYSKREEKGSAVNNGISIEGRRLVSARCPGHLFENEVTFKLRPEGSVGVSHKNIRRAS